jgi:cytochrome d ubiquinol oxidase subunit I
MTDTMARWQFGITTVYHYLFVPLTISLSVLTAVLQTIWNKTGNDTYLRLTKFFGRLFLINFAMGVVTGIVQEFQFGMNWSEYSRFVGDIFGAPLALEALIAFFLESTFLGIWIFGWDRLSKKAHLVTIWLGAAGAFLSSIFIVAANAWMQNPSGAWFNPDTHRAELNGVRGFGEVLLNPVFLTQWPHTIATSFMVGGGFMAGIAFYLLIKKTKQEAPSTDLVAYAKSVKLGAWVLIIAGAATIITGDFLGKTMVTTQPMKMAAAEHILTSKDGGESVGFQIIPGVPVFPGMVNFLYGTPVVPDMETIAAEQFSREGFQHWNRSEGVWAPGVPLQYGRVSAYDQLKDRVTNLPEDFLPDGYSTTPSVPLAFWSFRLMMGLGFLAIAGGVVLLVVTRGARVPRPAWYWTALSIALPLLPLLGNTCGWIFSEMARQPWIVNGVMPTIQGVSPFVGTGPVVLSLVTYTVIYGALAVVEVGLMLKYIRMGLPQVTEVTIKDEGEELSFAY